MSLNVETILSEAPATRAGELRMFFESLKLRKDDSMPARRADHRRRRGSCGPVRRSTRRRRSESLVFQLWSPKVTKSVY